MNKKTIVFDFDGVIHRYSKGWQGIDNIYDIPVIGIKDVIDELRQEYEVAIVSTRTATEEGKEAIEKWLKNIILKSMEFIKKNHLQLCI